MIIRDCPKSTKSNQKDDAMEYYLTFADV